MFTSTIRMGKKALVSTNGTNNKTSRERRFCGWKRLVDERGQRRMARLVEADKTVAVTQITTHSNSGMQKRISEHTSRQTSKWIGYSGSRLNMSKK